MAKKEPKSLQDTFEKVADFVYRQGHQSTESGRRCCLYNGPGGSHCAVGCLIPSEQYHEEMEGGGIRYWLKKEKENPGNVATVMRNEGYDLGLLQRLQEAHDNLWDASIFLDLGWVRQPKDRTPELFRERWLRALAFIAKTYSFRDYVPPEGV